MSENQVRWQVTLTDPWYADSMYGTTCGDRTYVSLRSLALALGFRSDRLNTAIQKMGLSHLLIDLSNLKDKFGNAVKFAINTKLGVRKDHIINIVHALDKFTKEEKTLMLNQLYNKNNENESSIKIKIPRRRRFKNNYENGEEEEEEEVIEILPQRKRFSPDSSPVPNAVIPVTQCECAKNMLTHLEDLKRSIVEHSQLTGQHLYRNSEKFKEDQARWKLEEHEKLEKDWLPMIKKNAQAKIDSQVDAIIAKEKERRLSLLDKEIETIRAKRIAEVNNNSSLIVDEVNRFLLKK